MQKWKKISSKVILDHPRIKVIEDMVELPSGKITNYVQFENKGRTVTIIARNNEGKIWLQKEYSFPPNDEIYQFPGGLSPLNESAKVGANREFSEETNMFARKLEKLGDYYFNDRRTSLKCHVFLATDLVEKKTIGDDEENVEGLWLSEEEMEDMIREGRIKNVGALAAWSLYKTKM
jgi:ADP-ribose pyrophosphatase